MKAVVCHRYGSPDVLQLEQIDKPVVPDDGVLVRVHASSVNPADFFSLSPMAYIARMLTGPLKPRPEVLGLDFAGTVESVGGTRKVVLFIAKLNKADLVVLQELLEAGRVTPVVDRRYELSEVPAALRYMGEGHAKGKIVITV